MSKSLSQKIAGLRLASNGPGVRQTGDAIEIARAQSRRRDKKSLLGPEAASLGGLMQHLEPAEQCFGMDAARQSSQGAWTVRYGGHTRWVDLSTFGVDCNAVDQVPPEVAMAFNMIPLRIVGAKLLAAVPRNSELPAEEIGSLIAKDLHLVWADGKKIRAAIEWHYGVRCACA